MFGRLVQLDPADHYAHAGLGRTLQRRHRHREAIRHLRIASALSPEPWYAEALRRAEETVAAEPAAAGPAEPADDNDSGK
jgi:Flp pilus assembly protein TadD